ERREAGGQVGISERSGTGHEVEAVVEHVNASVVEVGRVQEVMGRAGRDREALVDRADPRAVDDLERHHRGRGWRYTGVPATDRPALRREQEHRRARGTEVV